jgi:Lrp/AsnC family transcriptional regulator, regulator of ectoine-degradation genes
MLRLDERDIEILAILSREGRISKTALAARINLSPSPCWERLEKLEKAGLIEGYHAKINLNQLVPHVVVFMAAELGDHTAESFRSFEAAVQKYDEITACWALGGGFDYLLQIVARDIAAYQQLVDQMLDAKIGLAKYFTYIVTKPIKDSVSPPFTALLDEAQKK